MSGGGAKPAKGGMSAKLVEEISPAELQALEHTLEASIATLASHRERKAALEAKVSKREGVYP